MRTFVRLCARLLLFALCASSTVVAIAAQAPAQKKPAAAAPAKNAAPAPQKPSVAQKPSAQPSPPVQKPHQTTAAQKAAAQQPSTPQKPAGLQPQAAQKPVTPPPPPAAKSQPAAARPPQAKVPAPEPRAAVAPPAPVPPPEVERPAAVESFVYKPEGRRDPFLSLVNRAVLTENRPSMKKPEGLRGLSWDEITLRGIFQGRTSTVALVQGPDTRTYQVRVGDHLYDAVVKAITADSLIALQEVNDPLSLQKQRERRKTLRVAEEVK